MADFDWSWPKEVPRESIESFFKLEFIEEKGNIILVGESGVGKTMIAKNIAHHAVTQGYTARFVTALEMLNNLSSRDAGRSLMRGLKTYASPDILIIDEIGYLASTAEHANLLFEVITMRYEQKPIILTSNKSVTQWGEVFPGAACVVAMVDRLIHRAHIVSIQAKSFRLKEAQERNAVHKGSRKTAKANRKDS